jgi:hypothetical protein
MFTLDSTTLFYFDLSNNARSSKITNVQQKTVDEWAQGVPPRSKSGHALPSFATSKSARFDAATSESTRSVIHPNVKTRTFDNGGVSDQDERTGAEAVIARNSPLKNGARVTREVRRPISLKDTFS